MDSVPVKKAVNRVKATLDKRKGPARKDQEAAPIADAIRDYWDRGMLTFGIPAHNGGRGPAPEVAEWAGLDAVRTDLPMSHGVDTRDRAWQVQAMAQELFAEAVGAKQTLFSTNGSSLSVHVAVMTVAGPGETIVMARNGHKSSFAGLILSGARPVYVDPYYDEDLELALTPVPAELARVLDAHPEARAALVFTPSYYGTSADVRAFADACHERGLALVTDDAWALDYALSGHPDLPEGALSQGSDLAIGSVHKTLSGLGQTSVLSVGSDRIDTERLQLCFELEESTSASALLLSSIDGARRQFVREGAGLLDRAVRAARLLRERLATEVPELRVVSVDELATRPGVAGVDPTHLLIETAAVGLTGYEADDWLRDERQVDVELVDHRRLMPLVTFAHGEAEVDRLVRALRDLMDERGEPGAETPVQALPSRAELRTEQAMLPRDAFFAATESVKPGDAPGRVSAELVTPYPPGIPAIAPGEIMTEAIAGYLEEVVANGGFVEGAADPSLGSFRVVARTYRALVAVSATTAAPSPRRDAGRRHRGAGLQRPAGVDPGAPGARGELALLVRDRVRAGERARRDLQLVPARGDPAGVRGLRRLRGDRLRARGTRGVPRLQVAPAAAYATDLGCWDELMLVHRLLERGNGADRRRADAQRASVRLMLRRPAAETDA